MKFTAMYEAATQEPGAADFTALRQAWAADEAMQEVAETPERDEELARAMAENDHQTVARIAGEMLAEAPLSIRLHMLASTAMELTGDAAGCERHKELAKGLVQSILGTGDGLSIETAFHVVSVEEEYAVVSLFGVEPTDQAFQEVDGRSYDVISVVSEDGSQEGQIFFNVDAVVGAAKGGGGCCGGHGADGGCCGGK